MHTSEGRLEGESGNFAEMCSEVFVFIGIKWQMNFLNILFIFILTHVFLTPIKNNSKDENGIPYVL